MPRIVISYRRQDSDGIAGRIRDRLAARYSADAVFMDIDSIPFGVDFRKYVAETLANTDVVLTIIGPKWAGGVKKQKTRIHDPADPVRIELETALQLQIPIIPVLVNGAVMPESEKLPETLKELSFRNAASVDAGRDFHPHVDRLIRSVDRHGRQDHDRGVSTRRRASLKPFCPPLRMVWGMRSMISGNRPRQDHPAVETAGRPCWPRSVEASPCWRLERSLSTGHRNTHRRSRPPRSPPA